MGIMFQTKYRLLFFIFLYLYFIIFSVVNIYLETFQIDKNVKNLFCTSLIKEMYMLAQLHFCLTKPSPSNWNWKTFYITKLESLNRVVRLRGQATGGSSYNLYHQTQSTVTDSRVDQEPFFYNTGPPSMKHHCFILTNVLSLHLHPHAHHLNLISLHTYAHQRVAGQNGLSMPPGTTVG